MTRSASPKYGFMNTSAGQLYKQSQCLKDKAAFIEIQIHDKLKANTSLLDLYKVYDDFGGFITIHGEGETDGIRKILFSSYDEGIRKRYVNESAALYSSIIPHLKPHTVSRIVVHPDTFNRKSPRSQQIRSLAESLNELNESLGNVEVCVEPRGGDRQGKILRAEVDDLQILGDSLGSSSKIGLCVDIAQLFIVHGQKGSERFLEELKTIHLPIKEFHVSDVSQVKKITNRVATEVGKGAIDWQQITPLMFQHCKELLIETLGGVKVFERSRSYIDALVMENEVLL